MCMGTVGPYRDAGLSLSEELVINGACQHVTSALFSPLSAARPPAPSVHVEWAHVVWQILVPQPAFPHYKDNGHLANVDVYV